MIKDLIKQIAYEEIPISKALTIAKIIAKKIGNQEFENWIKNEINGYESDESLPKYRKHFGTVKAEIMDQFGYNQEIVPISFSGWGENLQRMIQMTYFTQSISTLETNFDQLNSEIGQFQFPPEQVKVLEDGMKLREQYGRMMRSAWREVPKLQLKVIINRTKQILLDTLLELDKQFPLLENEFVNNLENNQKVSNIITNHIYGDNNPVNVASGTNVSQKDINFNINIQYSELEKLGVEKNEVEELKSIVKDNANDRSTLKVNVMKWLGRVSSSIAARGLYENIPAITEFVTNIIP
ncbi:MAG: hypothetical protein HYZ14_06615 [Bacteroidetes bacterium]|nr:hypothetical protein [Bacteroidota bacterium]